MAERYIEQIKEGGAVLGLEAELHSRLRKLEEAYADKQWTWCVSHSVVIRALAEELVKLQPKTKPQPCELTSPNPSSKSSSTP